MTSRQWPATSRKRGRFGADVVDFDPGGGGSENFGSLIKGGNPGGVAVLGGGGYVGPDPKDGAGTEQLSAQGRATAHQEVAEEAGGW